MNHTVAALRQSPEAGTESVSQLVVHARSGRIRVPDFQRGLRWQGKDVQDLFDSIYRGLPIGSLLFWRRRAQEDKFALGPLTINAPDVAEAWWVVDGQQRVTALAAALARDIPLPVEPIDPYVVFFDPRNTRFVTAPSRGALGVEWVPLPVLLDPTVLSEWVQEWSLAPDRELRRRVFEAGTRIRDYKVPRYLVDAPDDAAGRALLQEIFYRVNKKGKDLEWQEVHDALYGESNPTPTKISDLAIELTKLGMGQPSGKTLTVCLLALRGLDVTRPLSEHRDKDPEVLRGAVAEALPALRTSFYFLRKKCDIPHLRLLPRTFILDVLTRFFALNPEPSARTTDLLARWVWRVLARPPVLDERTLERRTIAAIDDGAQKSIQRMLDLLPSRVGGVPLLPTTFDARAAESRLATIALASLGPRDLISGEAIDVAELLELRGTSALRKIVTRGNDPAQRGAENRIFTRTSSSRYHLLARIADHGIEDEVLHSHGIGPKSAAALRDGKIGSFLRIRRKTLSKRLATIVARLTGVTRQDHDRPAIVDILSTND